MLQGLTVPCAVLKRRRIKNTVETHRVWKVKRKYNWKVQDTKDIDRLKIVFFPISQQGVKNWKVQSKS